MESKSSRGTKGGRKSVGFLRRSNARLDNVEWHSTSLHSQRIQASIPCVSLLRHKYFIPETNTIIQMLKSDDIVDMSACYTLSTSTSSRFEPSLKLSAVLLMDACITSNTTSWASLSWKDIISPLHLPCIQHKVFRLAFCSAMKQKSKIIYLLSKTILMRCMTRKFGGVCERTFQESYKTCDTVKLILLCSMLGNYMHSDPSTRPSAKTRAILYKILLTERTDPENHTWFMTILHKSPYLIEFAMRDFLVFHLDDDPALARHVNSLWSYESFKLVVCKTMNMVRVKMHTHLLLASTLPQMCSDVTHALQPYHSALLSLSYRLPKSRSDILAHITSLRDKLPLSMQYTDIKSEDEEIRIQEAEEDAFILDSVQNELTELGMSTLNMNERGTQTESTENKESRQSIRILATAKVCLGKTVWERLVLWSTTISTTRRDAFQEIVSLFPLVGVSIRATQRITFMIEELRVGALNLGSLLVAMRCLRGEEPYAYDILQIVIDLMKEKSRIRLLGTLPAHITQAQMKSHTTMLKGLEKTGYALYDSCDYVFCSVCNASYSMTRKFKSSYKKTYNYGYRDSICDYETGFLYCWRNRANHIGKCSEVPLVRLPLFGLIYQHGTETIMLCGLCGQVQCFDSDLCRYTDVGPACQKCCERMSCPEETEKTRLQKVATSNITCLLCAVVIKNLSIAFYYADEVYLCQKHHSKSMMSCVFKAQGNSTEKLSTKEVSTHLVEHYKALKLMRRDKQKVKWKKQLNISKLARNAKR